MGLKEARKGRSVPGVRLLGGIVGVILGFAVGIVLVEVIFPNDAGWPDVVPFALAVAGWPLGTAATDWLHRRHSPQLSRSH